MIEVPVVEVKILGGESIFLPCYATSGAVGADLKAAESVSISPGEAILVPTGIAVAIPHGYEGQIRPRSGLALREGLTILNTPGTIDSDYRGEVKAIIYNTSKETRRISRGDRFCQLVVSPVARAQFAVTSELSGTLRGDGGFGSSGR